MEQKPVLDSLLSIASFIFAVMGAWIAIVYPNGLQTIFSKKSDVLQLGRAKRLFRPMWFSSIIIGYSLAVQATVPLIKQMGFALQYQAFLRGINYAGLVLMLMLLVWSILYALLPAEETEQRIKQQSIDMKSRAQRTSRTQVGTRQVTEESQRACQDMDLA